MMHIKELVNRLSDPTITWYIAKAFGGWIRKDRISTTNLQLLHACDEIICIPKRFSEYLYWQDGSGGLVRRIFPNHMEAWDHTNETNPTTSTPYDGSMEFYVGYAGYWGWVDLTDGSTKARVYIAKRTYPELQILIFNTGTITIRVNDPPTGFGLIKYTTGSSGTDYVDLSTNQYVVYYKTTRPDIDSTNRVFAVSPMGSSKRYSYELYLRYISNIDLGFNLYTGIKTTGDINQDYGMLMLIHGGYANRGGINASGIINTGPLFDVYTDDPYCSQGTWRPGFTPLFLAGGWAEDENGNPKLVLISAWARKTNTKCEEVADGYTAILYDAELDEQFRLKVVKPITNPYSYGSAGSVQTPYTMDADFISVPGTVVIDAAVSRIITPTDSVTEWTSPASTTWSYYDAYAFMNCYEVTNNSIAVAALGIYTDDTGVSIPSDVRQAFGVARASQNVASFGMRIKPFQDRRLSTGMTYAVITRVKIFPKTATGTDLLNWAKKKYPYNISSSEWSSLLSIPLFTVALAGGQPPSGSIPFNISGTPAPGQTITVSGTCLRPNSTVWIVLFDSDTYTTLAKNSGSSDNNGNFSVSLTIPSNAQIGKTYKLYIIA
jgi:hypothetical protein